MEEGLVSEVALRRGRMSAGAEAGYRAAGTLDCGEQLLTPAATPYWPAPSREEELGILKDQADVMKRELEDIERRIQELERKQ
jgi:hypothetical protein